ncbi:unnamed protein product, partial [Linum tenue]
GVNVTVANLCSGDSCDTFTLSTDAFDVIAKHDAGRVQITYKRRLRTMARRLRTRPRLALV